jgi:histidinol-phosphate phosphatase family protein
LDSTWTLFLDRDGVINKRLPGDYVKELSEFEFLPGVPEAIAELSKIFGRIIVVTNQQGIGKGLYGETDLAKIHAFMIGEIQKAGGKIDAVFHAPQLASENSPMRKPGIGMALKAKENFHEIDFKRSVMAGDTASDMEFARRAGMKAFFIGENALKTIDCDDCALDLPGFARLMRKLAETPGK